MKKVLILFAVLLCTIIFIGSIRFFSPHQVEEQFFRVNKGESALLISQRLAQHKLISSQKLFYYFVRLANYDQYLSYGLYQFNGELSIYDVILIIKSGQVELRKLTIPEGLSVKNTIEILVSQNFGDRQRFEQLCSDPKFIKSLCGFDLNSIEGFLYPETYFFPEEASEEYIIKTMVQQHFNQTVDLDFGNDFKLNYYDVLKMAAIVEKEARVSSEKKTIASVYLNRLEINMKLQADPTVAYLMDQKGKKREKIYYKDLKIDSPYNTYIYSGLTPTPICSPSKSAISAVLNPAETDYFYFFASGGGAHTFSQTYSQHLSKQRVNKKNGT